MKAAQTAADEIVDEVAGHQRRREAEENESPARESLVADDRKVGDGVFEGRVGTGDDEQRCAENHEPDPPPPGARFPPASEQDGHGDEGEGPGIGVDLGEGKRSGETPKAEDASPVDVWDEELEEVRPRERAPGDEGEGGMRPLRDRDEGSSRRPLDGPEGNAGEAGESGPPEQAQPTREPTVVCGRLEQQVDEVTPSGDGGVDHDVRAPAQADPGEGACQQEGMPSGSGRAGGEAVEGDEHPAEGCCGGGEVDVHDL